MSSLSCASSPFENPIKERVVFVQFVTGGKYKMVRFLVHGDNTVSVYLALLRLPLELIENLLLWWFHSIKTPLVVLCF